jgi:hypothetical protein
MHLRSLACALLAATLTLHAQATDATPKGWFMAGTHPQGYRAGVEADGSAFFVSRPGPADKGFGTLMQSIKADNYLGKRVRLSASVRSENVAGWAGLWMRVDKGTQAIVLDNMQSRAIKGTTAWNTYEVVLDVPDDATSIHFGTLMDSTGEVWLNHLTLDIVSNSIPTTAAPWVADSLPTNPVNLDFRQ